MAPADHGNSDNREETGAHRGRGSLAYVTCPQSAVRGRTRSERRDWPRGGYYPEILGPMELTGADATGYLCGHPEMIEHGKGILQRRGFAKEYLKRRGVLDSVEGTAS